MTKKYVTRINIPAHHWCYREQGRVSLLSKINRGVNKMKDIKLSEIVESSYCRCDLHSACVKGENNDTLTCAKCTADTLEKSPDLDINRRKYGRYRPSLLISFFSRTDLD